ncbi:GNAT family N-acetyltransferase [Methylovirgula sp. 4M-Z18]|nr:GNAT family N-acetyltransferase [Methylovirgula sp. 4M-Z18]
MEPATLQDLDALHALEELVFDGDRLSRRSLRDFIRSPRVALLVASLGSEFAGYALVAFRKGSVKARLYSIATNPNIGRRGVGRALLIACENVARARHMQRLRLEVREDNAAAIRLYEKQGYRRFGDYEDYYEDGASAIRYDKAL